MYTNVINADFYRYIPAWMRDQVKMLYSQYFHREWFNEAFNTYRNVILDDVKNGKYGDKVHMPGYVFNKYLRREFEINMKLKSKPIELRNNFYQCRNCGKSFSIRKKRDMYETCPNCGIEFLKGRWSV